MHSTSRYNKQCAEQGSLSEGWHDEQCAKQGGRSDGWRSGRNEGRHVSYDANRNVKRDTKDADRNMKRDTKRSVQWFEFRGVRCRLLRWGCEESSAPDEGLSAPQNASRGASLNAPLGASLNPSLGEGQGFSSSAPVVFLHGFAQSADTWDEVAGSVAAKSGVAAYAVDFVGHGQSDKPAGTLAYSMDFTCAMLWALLRFVQRENAGRAPAVVGYSMGGRIALASVCRALQTLVAPGGKFCAELDASKSKSDEISLHTLSEKSLFDAGESQSGEISSSALSESPLFDAGDFPLSALILESAGCGPCSAEERMAVAQVNEQRACALRQQGISEFMDAWENLPLFFTQHELPEEVQKRVRAARMANDAEALARTLEGTGAQHMPARNVCVSALAALVKAGFPVCYIAGQRDEKYSELARGLREPLGLIAGAGFLPVPANDHAAYTGYARPGYAVGVAPDVPTARTPAPACADVCIAPGAGHNVHLEAPEWFSRKLFLLMSDFAY